MEIITEIIPPHKHRGVHWQLFLLFRPSLSCFWGGFGSVKALFLTLTFACTPGKHAVPTWPYASFYKSWGLLLPALYILVCYLTLLLDILKNLEGYNSLCLPDLSTLDMSSRLPTGQMGESGAFNHLLVDSLSSLHSPYSLSHQFVVLFYTHRL